MTTPKSDIGRQLWELLPVIYRARDGASTETETNGEGALAETLDSCGVLLDRLRATLDQRLADSFPDTPRAGPTCQDWVLPYFATLLDVRLVSPHPAGRRAEIADAVRWRQRKGTIQVVDEVAEAITGAEIVVQEGWKRVARTPRIGLPLLPASALGAEHEPDADDPLAMARHPGLPAVTVDFGRPSRAVLADPSEPAAHRSVIRGESVAWKQANLHGAPCFPDSFEDVSRRTVDLRTPGWSQGRHHPKRVLVHAPPPAGLFGLDPVLLLWAKRNVAGHEDHFEEVAEGGDLLLRNPSRAAGFEGAPATVTFTSSPGTLHAGGGEVRVEDLNFEGTLEIDGGTAVLRRVAARKLVVTNGDLDAVDCLFESIEVAGVARLEYCTTLKTTAASRVQASDCIFGSAVTLSGKKSCIRYSRIPPGLGALHENVLRPGVGNTTDKPTFVELELCEGGVPQPPGFGSPGTGVLHASVPDSIGRGAEDGGEMGAHHHLRLRLATAALLDKLLDFLPVGIETVLVSDARLHHTPPDTSS